MRKRMILILLAGTALIGLAAVIWGLYFYFQRPSFAEGYAGYPRAEVAIREHSIRVVVADTMARRNLGLSGRPSMPEGEGMLFKFQIPAAHSFWMKDMHFPLDIVWIRDGKIVDISRDVPPPAPGTSTLSLPTYAPSSAIDSVLEVNAGIAARYGWQPGDAVMVREAPDGV